METLARLETGIPGLDTVLKGGLLAGSSYIVQGRPGSGKTILANQIAFHHARQGGRVLFATLLSESHERLFHFLSSLSFFSRERIGNEIQFVSAFDTLESEGLDEVVKLLRREIARQRASVLVVDGVLNARSRADNTLDTKKFIAELQGHAAFAGCTVLLLTSARMDDSSPEHTMVDGVIELGEDLVGVRSIRRLHLRKTRGSGAIGGLHNFRITPDGIVVHPRLEAVLGSRPNSDDPEPGDERVSSGVQDLDKMTGGGLQRNSATLVIGPSGTAKTSLGLNFITQCTMQEPGLIFGFYETAGRLQRKAERMGLDLRQKMESGAVRLMWQPAAEHLMDELGYRLLDAVRQGGYRRVMIDSLGAIARTVLDQSRRLEFFAALINELRAMGTSVTASWEIRDMFDANAHAPAMELSSIFDNLLLVRLVEVRSELRRVFSVIKVRDSGFEPSLRELVITDHGIRLSRAFESMSTITTGTLNSGPGN
ncbi:ATPase domain-containing protein [Roseomonas marmotae]|uniref:non-specific serine/threonine protein kinase n=1 Tax=Roseomonas marmotae TaxID=2768161 RepID=A0ABS3KJA8_9PROT|nr:ATPase domain-containing protein [Roseomonas marmotae]MBO1077060.1 AAA family ATPase [Roseomonas marmotae]QTI81885.1 AAA family ATPase [Roseomonas marmotae]